MPRSAVWWFYLICFAWSVCRPSGRPGPATDRREHAAALARDCRFLPNPAMGESASDGQRSSVPASGASLNTREFSRASWFRRCSFLFSCRFRRSKIKQASHSRRCLMNTSVYCACWPERPKACSSEKTPRCVVVGTHAEWNETAHPLVFFSRGSPRNLENTRDACMLMYFVV